MGGHTCCHACAFSRGQAHQSLLSQQPGFSLKRRKRPPSSYAHMYLPPYLPATTRDGILLSLPSTSPSIYLPLLPFPSFPCRKFSQSGVWVCCLLGTAVTLCGVVVVHGSGSGGRAGSGKGWKRQGLEEHTGSSLPSSSKAPACLYANLSAFLYNPLQTKTCMQHGW